MPQPKRKPQPKTEAKSAAARKRPQKWQLQTAKAQFSEVFRRARTEGPQHVTKQGKEEVVIVASEEFARLMRRQTQHTSLAQLLLESPLRGAEIDLERRTELARKIDL